MESQLLPPFPFSPIDVHLSSIVNGRMDFVVVSIPIITIINMNNEDFPREGKLDIPTPDLLATWTTTDLSKGKRKELKPQLCS